MAHRAPIKTINIRVKKESNNTLDILSKELTRLIFNAYFLDFEMVLALQSEHPFMQIADLFATLSLLEYKVKEGSLSTSENVFFGERRMLKRTYLGILKIKSF